MKLLEATLAEAHSGREIVWDELIKTPWIKKGKTSEDMSNYFDMKTRYAKEYASNLLKEIKKEEALHDDQSVQSRG